jgi:hypothetical protein
MTVGELKRLLAPLSDKLELVSTCDLTSRCRAMQLQLRRGYWVPGQSGFTTEPPASHSPADDGPLPGVLVEMLLERHG